MDCEHRPNYKSPFINTLTTKPLYWQKKDHPSVADGLQAVSWLSVAYSFTNFDVITLPLCTSFIIYNPAAKRPGAKVAR